MILTNRITKIIEGQFPKNATRIHRNRLGAEMGSYCRYFWHFFRHFFGIFSESSVTRKLSSVKQQQKTDCYIYLLSGTSLHHRPNSEVTYWPLPIPASAETCIIFELSIYEKSDFDVNDCSRITQITVGLFAKNATRIHRHRLGAETSSLCRFFRLFFRHFFGILRHLPIFLFFENCN